jgi:hypothetical protein
LTDYQSISKKIYLYIFFFFFEINNMTLFFSKNNIRFGASPTPFSNASRAPHISSSLIPSSLSIASTNLADHAYCSSYLCSISSDSFFYHVPRPISQLPPKSFPQIVVLPSKLTTNFKNNFFYRYVICYFTYRLMMIQNLYNFIII